MRYNAAIAQGTILLDKDTTRRVIIYSFVMQRDYETCHLIALIVVWLFSSKVSDPAGAKDKETLNFVSKLSTCRSCKPKKSKRRASS